jgi:hypothetical protein
MMFLPFAFMCLTGVRVEAGKGRFSTRSPNYCYLSLSLVEAVIAVVLLFEHQRVSRSVLSRESRDFLEKERTIFPRFNPQFTAVLSDTHSSDHVIDALIRVH